MSKSERLLKPSNDGACAILSKIQLVKKLGMRPIVKKPKRRLAFDIKETQNIGAQQVVFGMPITRVNVLLTKAKDVLLNCNERLRGRTTRKLKISMLRHEQLKNSLVVSFT